MCSSWPWTWARWICWAPAALITSAADFNIEDYNIADYVGDNVALITYQEEQAGYLAGYATVKDGYTKLGFLGGIAVPAVVRYGYGFVQGAEAAAEEMGVDVSMKYWYSGSFTANDDIKARMDSWYADGTEVIFSCGGGIYSSAISAAEASANGGKIIGVDVDQSADGEMVITSATKSLAHSVELALTDCMNNGWQWTDTYAAKETKLAPLTSAWLCPWKPASSIALTRPSTTSCTPSCWTAL